MAKRIKFPLEMADGAQVRNLDELREHFDLETVLEYYKSGRLLTWLQDRYFDDEAAAVEELDEQAADFQQKLCGIFGVAYTGEAVDLEEISRRQERLDRLRTVTDEVEFIGHIDQVAFDQEELADLLDEEETTIYLCGEKFTIPASRKGVKYVGINSPSVHISGKTPEEGGELGIEFYGCNVDNLPQESEAGCGAGDKSELEIGAGENISGFEEITLSGSIHVAQGETCTYKNKIIHFEASMVCEGALEFDTCVLHYGEVPGAGQIRMTETSSLAMCRCTVKNHSSAEQIFIDGESAQKCFSFNNCKFLNCRLFLKINSKLTLNQCELINPQRDFIRGKAWSDKVDISIEKCEFLFLIPPAFLLEAEESDEFGNDIINGYNLHISKSSAKGNIQLLTAADVDKNAKSNAPLLFAAKQLRIDRSSFCGVSRIASSSGTLDISLSIFEHCLNVLESGTSKVVDCRFDNCSSIALDLGGNSRFSNCQFNDCFSKLLKTRWSGGVIISFCEFNNWVASESSNGGAMMQFARSNKNVSFSSTEKIGRLNVVEKCIFNGIKARKSFLISGWCDDWPENEDVVHVKKCNFINCKSEHENLKLIKEYDQVKGWFNTPFDVKAVYITDCTGLDKVNVGEGYNDHVTLKTHTSGGVALGIPNK